MDHAPWQVIQGDALSVLRTLPAGAFATCITSPPYFALRSYLKADDPLKHLEQGSESSPDCLAWARGVPRCDACWVCRMTTVFAEVRRVLRDDGTLWVNVAGSYATGGTCGGGSPVDVRRYGQGGPSPVAARQATQDSQRRVGGLPAGWKQKDYVNTPALLAESLRADGWILRSEIALTKVAPMPESCRDRPTRATEKLYLFAKRGAYYYDGEAERPEAEYGRREFTGPSMWAHQQRADARDYREGGTHTVTGGDHSTGRNLWDWWDSTDDDLPPAVWPWRPEPRKGSGHYATFPLWLPLRCIRLGTSARGCCPHCGAPWRRVVETTQRPLQATNNRSKLSDNPDSGWDHERWPRTKAERETLGWAPSCTCVPAADPVPARVLDPFAGTATTGVAARLLGRAFMGIELSPDYCALARERLAGCVPLDDAAFRAAVPLAAPAQGDLFDAPLANEKETPS